MCVPRLKIISQIFAQRGMKIAPISYNKMHKKNEAGATLQLNAERSRNCVWTASFESGATFVKTVFVFNIK